MAVGQGNDRRAAAGRGSGRAAVALAPAAGAAVFGLWAGTAAGGATAAGAIAGHALLLVAAAAAAPAWRDPLALGRRGKFLPWALWALAAAAAWASPVPRAGRVAVTLLPAFLLLPAAVARAWRGGAGRRRGALGVAAVTAASALWALGGRFFAGDPRAAAPLGHHLLLAVWLLALLPVAALPALRERGGGRALGVLAVTAAAAALAAAGSLAGWGGLALEGALGAAVALRAGRRNRAETAAGTRDTVEDPEGRAGRRPSASAAAAVRLAGASPADRARRRRGWAIAAAAVAGLAVLAVLALPRLVRLGAGADVSARARMVYARAGLAGAADRPALGWGPGSTPWTLADHLRPVPGVNPPGEVVAELHALPVQLAYELGLPGLLLAAALGALFARRRLAAAAPTAPAADPALARAGLIGLAGAGVALAATAWLAVTALPVALALAAGAALAGAAGEPAGPASAAAEANRTERPGAAGRRGRARGRGGWRRGWPGVLYCAAAAAALLPLDLAQLAYDRAVAAGERAARRAALARAVRLDPGFPLYRAWLAWDGEGVDRPPAVAAGARRAAADAHGVGPLWLAAGVYAADAGAPWAAAALDRACDLDPLGALAPFHRMALDPSAPGAAAAGGRALLAAPRLAAATFWVGREELLGAALVEVASWDGIDAGWRGELVRQVTEWDAAAPGALADLALRVDPSGAESLLLRSFRRRPRPFLLAAVTVRRGLAAQVTVPPATELATSSPAAFAGPGCGAPGRRAAASGR